MTKIKDTSMDCPICEGTGCFEVYHVDSNSMSPYGVGVICQNCDETGEVSAKDSYQLHIKKTMEDGLKQGKRIEQLEQENRQLKTQKMALVHLLTELYQVLGVLDASELAMDKVSAAINEDPIPERSLLPYFKEEAEYLHSDDITVNSRAQRMK